MRQGACANTELTIQHQAQGPDSTILLFILRVTGGYNGGWARSGRASKAHISRRGTRAGTDALPRAYALGEAVNGVLRYLRLQASRDGHIGA